MKLPEKSSWLIQFLICLFPLLIAGVRDGGSTVFFLLMIMGLIYGWPAWRALQAWERQILIGFMVFFAVLLLSMINTQEFAMAFRKLERFIRLLAVIPIYLLLRRSGVMGGRALIIGSALGCILLAVEAWYQVNVSKTEPYATGAYHKIILGDTAVLLTSFVLLGMMFFARRWWHYLFGVVCIGAGLYACALSLTRAAWLFVPVAVLLWIWMYRNRLTRQVWLKIGGSFIAALVIGVIWQPAAIIKGINSGMADIRGYQQDPNKTSSWGERFNMWRDAWTIFKANPVLGTGIGDYTADRKQLMMTGEARNLPTHYGHAHSIYFNALATTGILGTLTMLVVLFVLPWRAQYQHWQSATEPWLRFYVLGGVTTTVAFAVFGLGEAWLVRNPFINEYTFFTMLFLSGIANILHPIADNESSQ